MQYTTPATLSVSADPGFSATILQNNSATIALRTFGRLPWLRSGRDDSFVLLGCVSRQRGTDLQ